jgi:hypothetical protein
MGSKQEVARLCSIEAAETDSIRVRLPSKSVRPPLTWTKSCSSAYSLIAARILRVSPKGLMPLVAASERDGYDATQAKKISL